MGQQQSKDELLYQQVNYGNVEGIKALRAEGAGLEWIDSEAKTPLIAACMNPELYNVAKTLIELGANTNAYRPGRHAGTPLHHAAKRGLESTVKLLLSNGANALIFNDDCQTPLDVARAKGYSNVVRTIEEHVCLYSGWLRELYGPGIIERFAPQLLSRKVWVVVYPCGSRNLRKPIKLELAIYSSAQDAQPRMTIPLWKSHLHEPNLNDPAATISDTSSGIRIKLAPVQENEKLQLLRFCDSCKGIPQVIHPSYRLNGQEPTAQATAPPTLEDVEMAMALNASLQSARHEYQPQIDSSASTSSAESTNTFNPENNYDKGASSSQETNENHCLQPITEDPPSIPTPSAPIADTVVDDGLIHYPTIDMSTVDLSSTSIEGKSNDITEKNEKDGISSSCTICLDAPLEGACIPCGHMAGCMSCLKEIKSKKWGCPVCRTKIDQIVRIYAV